MIYIMFGLFGALCVVLFAVLSSIVTKIIEMETTIDETDKKWLEIIKKHGKVTSELFGSMGVILNLETSRDELGNLVFVKKVKGAKPKTLKKETIKPVKTVKSRKASKFKVGDMVQIVQTKECDGGYVPALDRHLGEIGKITDVDLNNTDKKYIYRLDSNDLAWGASNFKLVNLKPIKKSTKSVVKKSKKTVKKVIKK